MFFSSIIIINYIVSFFVYVIYLWSIYEDVIFVAPNFRNRLAKTGVFRHKFWIWNRWPRISTARWAAIHPSSNCTTHSRDPLCDPFHSQWLTGGTPDVIWMNMRKTQGFPTMLSKAPRTSNGQDFKAQQNIETIAEVLWSFGSRYLLWNWKVVSHYELFGKIIDAGQ